MSIQVIGKGGHIPRPEVQAGSFTVVAVGKAAILTLFDTAGAELRIELRGKAAEQLAAWYFEPTKDE